MGKVETLEGRQNIGSPTWLPSFMSVNLFEPVCPSAEMRIV